MKFSYLTWVCVQNGRRRRRSKILARGGNEDRNNEVRTVVEESVEVEEIGIPIKIEEESEYGREIFSKQLNRILS